MNEAVVRVPSVKVTAQSAVTEDRFVPAEVPVALVYDGATHAVMMASPTDLEDFAVGFSLTEGIIKSPSEIEGFEMVRQPQGIELRLWLAPGPRKELAERRRHIAGPTGCGLCGIESLEAAVTSCPQVAGDLSVSAQDILDAIAALAPAQTLNRLAHAVHGAALWSKERGLVAIAEDVGRHNALDKLIGKLQRAGIDAAGGIIVLTSRVSVEMVQKTARAGAPVIVAVSAPTALALETADRAGVTIVAVARADGFEVFTHPRRVRGLSPKVGGCETGVGHAA